MMAWLAWRWQLARARYHERRLRFLLGQDGADFDLVIRLAAAYRHRRWLETGRPWP